MTKYRVMDLISRGWDPKLLGRLAHRILDYSTDVLVSGDVYVKTKARDWHRATTRELEIIGNWDPSVHKSVTDLAATEARPHADAREVRRCITKMDAESRVQEFMGTLFPV